MRSRRGLYLRLFALLSASALLFAACGGDDDDDGATGAGSTEETTGGGEAGGELIDLGTFVGDPPEFLDPALNTTLDAYQVINALYDGLTEIDATDPANPVLKPLVAESFEPNDDATVWTFTIREGLTFSDGEPVLPSSFVRAWERASNPDFAGDYSYLYNFIQGGAEKLAGDAETLAGVEADDDAMTLTVTLSAPYSNFATVAGFQIFFPMPSAVDDLADQNEWQNGMMIGNGPYMLEKPRTDEEIVLVRNPEWGGDIFGNTEATLDRITFRTSADPETAYNAFEAGEGDTANIPPGRVNEADQNYATTLDVRILGSYYFDFKWDDPVVGGPENVKLRQAISQAINREEINDAVYEGTRTTSTGITPVGIPGAQEGLCDYCTYDAEAAQAAFDEWTAAGNALDAPLKIQLNAGAGHEDAAGYRVLTQVQSQPSLPAALIRTVAHKAVVGQDRPDVPIEPHGRRWSRGLRFRSRPRRCNSRKRRQRDQCEHARPCAHCPEAPPSLLIYTDPHSSPIQKVAKSAQADFVLF